MRFPQGSERDGFFWGGQVCPDVTWSKVWHILILNITGDGLLITHGWQKALGPWRLGISVSFQHTTVVTGFKGSVTLACLLTANGGGARLGSIQTVKPNINLIQTPYNFILAWEQWIHRDMKSEKAPKIHKALSLKHQITYKLLTITERPNNKIKTWVSGNAGENSVNLK